LYKKSIKRLEKEINGGKPMSECLDKEKTLMLDAYGELDPQELEKWEKHLRTCDRCLREKERLSQLFVNIKQSIDSPCLDSDMEKAFAENIVCKLEKKRKVSNKFKIKSIKILWPAAACVLLIVFGIYNFKIFQTGSENRYQENLNLAEMISGEELEIISNLDILKDIDSIKKIVQLVDHPEINGSSENNSSEIQGMIQNYHEKYV